MKDIRELTAAEISALFASGELSPVEVTETCLGRIEALDAAVNAFCHLDHAASLAMAERSERRWLEGRLRALAFAHDQSLSGQGGDLLALMEAEASLHRYGNEDHVAIDGPPLGLTDRAFGVLALLMHEMMTNAASPFLSAYAE